MLKEKFYIAGSFAETARAMSACILVDCIISLWRARTHDAMLSSAPERGFSCAPEVTTVLDEPWTSHHRGMKRVRPIFILGMGSAYSQ